MEHGKLYWILIDMEKNGLAKIISEILAPAGFKRKGNYWVLNGDEVTKMVNLQKSSHGNFFYVNYGYIINSIPLENSMRPIYNRVTSMEVEKRNRIALLLNLESDISDADRTNELEAILLKGLVDKVQAVNTEVELADELMSRHHLNDVPLSVKNHFGLVE